MTVRVVRVGNQDPVVVIRVGDGGGVVGPATGERWWQGSGPPPDLIVGAQPGDWYWDTITGNVYELTEGV